MGYEEFDVAIVGSGITALIAARSFSMSSARVGIISASTELPDTDNIQNDRNYSIIESSRRFLDFLGVWSKIENCKIGLYKAIEVWDLVGEGYLRFNAPLGYEKPMGWVVSESILLNALKLLTGNVPRFSGLKAIKEDSSCSVLIELTNDQKIACGLLVLADGHSSNIRENLGFEFQLNSYDQIGIVADIHTELPHRNKARQWFSKDTILAFLPKYEQNSSSIVFSVETSAGRNILGYGNNALSECLVKSSKSELGKIQVTGMPRYFTLSKAIVDIWYKGRCVLVGNAAHEIHPLAGQGLNQNMMDVASLVECVGEPGLEKHWPSVGQLSYYNRWRKSESQGLLLITDSLNKIFLNPLFRTSKIRGRVINNLNRLDGVKEIIVRRAMGLSGDLPRTMLRSPK